MLVNILQSVKEWVRDWSESTFLKLSGGTLTGTLNSTSATFSSTLDTMGNVAIKSSNIDRAETPLSDIYSDTHLILRGASGTPLVFFDTARFSAGETVSRWVTFNQDSNSVEHYSIVQHVKPATSVNNDGYINSQADIHLNHKKIYWKEDGYGDKFAITPYFDGVDDANLLKIQSAVGGAGTDPTLTDKVTISGKSGDVAISGRICKTVSSGISYIDGNKGNAALYLSKGTGNVWYPAVTLDTTSGGSWSIGNYNSENLQFSWASKANRDSSTNTVTVVNLPNAPGIIPVPVQLYNNTSGSNGTITLSASAANYTHMRIYYKSTDDATHHLSSVDVYSPNGTVVVLSCVDGWKSGNTWIQSRLVKINGTSIATFDGNNTHAAVLANGNTQSSVANYIYILRVEGWN